MTKNITYLLGAGASANCLPVIDGVPKGLRTLLKLLDERIDPATPESRRYNDEILIKKVENLIVRIELILEDLGKHYTIDTLAKKYFLTNKKQNLKILKEVLIVYLIFEQTYRNTEIEYTVGGERKTKLKELPDRRYDSLIATILKKSETGIKLPGNFKIITWNYDVQFEFACSEYFTKKSLLDIQREIQAIPTHQKLNEKNILDLSNFLLIRLNGIAGIIPDYLYYDRLAYPRTLEGIKDADMFENSYLNSLIKYHEQITSEKFELFNYAWEQQDSLYMISQQQHSVRDVATEIMKNTEILVVIGYSFPNFNRSIDKLLFQNCPILSKVYVQDYNSEMIKSLMISSFPALSKKKFKEISKRHEQYGQYNEVVESDESVVMTETVKGVDQFFIPPEADI